MQTVRSYKSILEHNWKIRLGNLLIQRAFMNMIISFDIDKKELLLLSGVSESAT